MKYINEVPRTSSREPTEWEWERELTAKVNGMLSSLNIRATPERVQRTKKALRITHSKLHGKSNLTDWRILTEWDDYEALKQLVSYAEQAHDTGREGYQMQILIPNVYSKTENRN